MTFRDEADAIAAKLPSISEEDVQFLCRAVRDLFEDYHNEYARVEELCRELAGQRDGAET